MENKNLIIYKEDDLLFKEIYIKEGLEISRKKSNLFQLIMIAILLINCCAANSTITSIPNLLYEPTYLCKQNSTDTNYTVKCEKTYVCNETNKDGVDYILDEKHYIRSLITDYGIYCSNTKISTFSVGYFVGGVIGLIVLPEILKVYGNIEAIIYPSIICIICNIGMLFIKTYSLGIIVFTISMIARNILQVPTLQYKTEMIRSSERAIVMGLTIAMNSISGLIVNLMEITVGDYKGEIISNTFLFIISIILVKLLLVDSASNTFVRGKYKQIIEDLEFVAKVNGSEKEYGLWKKKIYSDSRRELLTSEFAENPSRGGSNNKYEFVTYFSIWSLKGVSVKLVFFILFFFASQFNLIFLLNEVKKAPNFYLISSLCYVCDILGSFFGSFMIDIPILGRRMSSVIMNGAAGVAYFFTVGIAITTGNFYLIFLNRFLNAALQIIVYTYAFECFPTVLRPHATSTFRILGRVLNIGTPFLMIDYSMASYFIIGLLDVFLAISNFFFNIPETYGKPIDELPEEFKDAEYLKKLRESYNINNTNNTNSNNTNNNDNNKKEA